MFVNNSSMTRSTSNARSALSPRAAKNSRTKATRAGIEATARGNRRTSMAGNDRRMQHKAQARGGSHSADGGRREAARDGRQRVAGCLPELETVDRRPTGAGLAGLQQVKNDQREAAVVPADVDRFQPVVLRPERLVEEERHQLAPEHAR